MDIARAKQQEVRAHLLKVLDRDRPDAVSEALLLRSLHQAGLRLVKDELVQELAYLEAKDLIGHEGQQWYLLPLGIDVLERSVEPPSGIPAPTALGVEVLVHRKEVRSRILTALYYGRPHGLVSTILWRALDDSDLPVTEKELAREASYLAAKALVEVTGEIRRDWHAKLTAAGIDLMEYSTDPPPGIDRIEKYWEG